MSTAPKLTYAKIGNKSKQKIQNNSSELGKNQQQKSQDLFAQMNQDNLNYIKKQLKLKKHRSDVDKNNNPTIQKKQEVQNLQEQTNQRDKIFNKYRGSEELSQKQPHLQQTQRKSSEGRPLNLNLPEDIEEDYNEAGENNYKQNAFQKKTLTHSYNKEQTTKVFTKNEPDPKMYHSLPYEQAKKRMISIQGFCGQALSINLNRNKQEGANFINFLQGYITDLNHSKHMKSKQYDETSIDKASSNKKSKMLKEVKYKQQNVDMQQLSKQDLLNRYEHFKRNSDTFGQPNSKYTLKSSSSYGQNIQMYELQLQLKQQKLNSITLAKQIEKLRSYLLKAQERMKEMQLQNELLSEQVIHLRKNQQIYLKNKSNININIQNHQNNKYNKKINMNLNDENMMYQFQKIDKLLAQNHHRHDRHGSVNPSLNRFENERTYRAQKPKIRYQQLHNQPPNLFKRFENPTKPHKSKPTSSIKQKQSLERSQRQYQQFLIQTKKNKLNYNKKQENKYKQQFF